MFLALREIRRSPVRFTLLALAIALLLFLVLFQQAIQQGLITSFVGAVRNQSAEVVVYGVDAQRTLQGSVIPPPLEQAVLGVDGIGASARLDQRTFTVSIGGDDAVDATLIGTDDATLGRPESLSAGRAAEAHGEAVGSDHDFAVGDTVEVLDDAGAPAATITVVGVAGDVQLSVTPTLFTDLATYEDVVRAVNPQAGELLPNALLLAPDGVDAATLVERVNAAVPDADAVTRAVAADTTPGVSQVRQSFRLIFALYGLVVPLVTGLFFLIVTLQKSRSLTLLRAVGAPAGVLARALVVQVLAVTGVGIVVGVGLYAPVVDGRIGGFALRYDPSAVTLWSAAFLALALIGAIASLRRVLAIDPIEATTGGGGR